MLFQKIQPEGAYQQYKKYRERFPFTGPKGRILSFEGIDGADVYNTSIPFTLDGREIIAARVEPRSSERSRTMFFYKDGDRCSLILNAPVLDLQDPFIAWIGGELVVGGVSVDWTPEEKLITYRTRFYRGKTLQELHYFTEGPDRMKDIRLIQLPNGRVGVFTRPQGKPMLERFGCIAKIGFDIVDSLEEINPGIIDHSPLLEGHFLPEEWGGCNQIYNLSNGLLGIIGHKSWGEMTGSVKIIHYYCMAFAMDPQTRWMSQVKVIAAREDYPEGPQKNARAMDVAFSSGIVRLGNGRAEMYTGLSDCQEGILDIEDPFDEYEQWKMQEK